MTISLFLAYFAGHFCYHSNGKSKIDARILPLDHSSDKPIGWNWWKATFSFWPQRGPNLPLNARTPLSVTEFSGYKLLTCCHILDHWWIGPDFIFTNTFKPANPFFHHDETTYIICSIRGENLLYLRVGHWCGVCLIYFLPAVLVNGAV